MRDPYSVLGLAKTASAAEIKSAFRKLAKKYHPDQSKEAKAKERFAEVGQAYEILGDEKKRAAFDRGEIDAEGKPRAPQFEGFGAGGAGGGGFRNFHFDFGAGDPNAGRNFDPDIFAEMFGGGMRSRARPPARGEDVAVSVTVPLAQVASGGEVRVSLPTGKTLDVAVPVGFEDGKTIRLRGQGEPGQRNGPPGDALVTLRFAPHPLFKVEGRDLRLDLPITLYEAVLGAKVRAPTLSGAVEISVAAGTSSGRVLRLRGKGLPGAGDAAPGDLMVTLRIALPPQEDKALAELMRQWRDEKPYDPRQGLNA
ncbi:MAG: J domain-containing protein [Pseudomonadota bacterium]|nr:J domain-containing protein [Pseudomonadota bacterium]